MAGLKINKFLTIKILEPDPETGLFECQPFGIVRLIGATTAASLTVFFDIEECDDLYFEKILHPAVRGGRYATEWLEDIIGKAVAQKMIGDERLTDLGMLIDHWTPKEDEIGFVHYYDYFSDRVGDDRLVLDRAIVYSNYGYALDGDYDPKSYESQRTMKPTTTSSGVRMEFHPEDKSLPIRVKHFIIYALSLIDPVLGKKPEKFMGLIEDKYHQPIYEYMEKYKEGLSDGRPGTFKLIDSFGKTKDF